MTNIEKGLQLPERLHARNDNGSHHYKRDSLSTTCSSTPFACDPLQKELVPNGLESGTEIYPQRKRYLTVFGAFLSLLCTFGQMNSFGTFQTWYSIHQLDGLPSSTISWIGSLQLWVFFFSGSAIGYLFDLYGPTVLMACGTVCFVLSAVLTSISTHYYHYILSQGILFGVGVGLLATALGIAAGGSSLGGVLYPLLLRSLFEHVGFGWTMRIIALISLVLCGIATIMVSSPEKSTGLKNVPGKDKDCSAFSRCLRVFGLNDSRFLLLILGSCLVALGLFIPIFYLSSFTHETLSISSSTSFLVIAALNAGGIFGRVAPAIVSDRLGHYNILAPSAFLSGLLVLTAWFIPASKAEELLMHLRTTGESSPTSSMHGTLVPVLIFAVLYGVSSGAFISLINPCVVKITDDIKTVGRRIGFFYTVISFPSLVGGPIAGALLSSEHGSYHGMILFSGITLVIGSFFIFAARLAVDPRIRAQV
ncbi:hypothetical protein VKT23_011670 [Stygiomarasmius scandens]|uniref:Major facilitator superfamily (MFS) profile domain-containing protein n=1 Tax=Marasmiellus scandens TaxID=2682957 RepID=A0ABR1JDA1_9AGAR